VFVFRDQQCVGVVPCFLHDWDGSRQITLAGSGISDYLDPILAPKFEEEIVAELGQQLRSTGDWDICNWQDLGRNTPFSWLASVFPLETRDETICSEVALPQDFDEYWQQRPRHLRRNIKRYSEKARAQGELKFEALTEARSELMNALLRLHTARWNAKGEIGMIAANRSGEFLSDIAQQFEKRDMLRLFTLTCGTDVVAVILAFACDGRVFGYLTGSEPAFHCYSVASLLLHESLRFCCAHGFRVWNFCRGDEPYKADWGARTVPRCRLLIHNSR
jgi:CelD/BcsL family acetyltransferase involved in cellulose biosynthesis